MQIIEIAIKEKQLQQGKTGCLASLLLAGQFIGYAIFLIVLLAYMGFFV